MSNVSHDILTIGGYTVTFTAIASLLITFYEQTPTARRDDHNVTQN